MKDSNIEWTNHTFNPWIGCTKVSPGCLNCYAEALNKRWRKGVNWGNGAPRQRTGHANWSQPRKWNDEAKNKPRPRVFCASLADWLDDEVPIEWLADLLKLIHDTPNLDWLLLTKRPENFEVRLGQVKTECEGFGAWLLDWFCATAHQYNAPDRFKSIPHNIWIGTTVEDQQRADERIPALLNIPARVRFLSCEPLLGEVDLCRANGLLPKGDTFLENVDWLICGGESGTGKRAFNPEWGRSLRDECTAAGVPFFMKQIDKVRPIPQDLLIRQFPSL